VSMGETPLSSAKISELLFKETFCRRNPKKVKDALRDILVCPPKAQ
jgi:hypothetical protein